jgi:hypothetical protein
MLLSDEMLRPQQLKPDQISGTGLSDARYWYYNLSGKARLVKEGSVQTVPAGTWFNTADGKTYRGGDKLEIWTSVYLIKL